MVNPLGLGYDDEDSEEEEEEDDVETQHAGAAVNGLVPNGGQTKQTSPAGADDEDGDLEDVVDAQRRGTGGALGDGPEDASPVGRADAIDAETDALLGDAEEGSPGAGVGRSLTGEDSGEGVAEAASEVEERLGIPPPAPCPEALKDRILTLVTQQNTHDLQVLQVLRDNKAYRNPAFMERVVAHYNVYQYGSSWPVDKFDPRNLPPEDNIAVMTKELEAKRQARRAARANAPKPSAVAVPAPTVPTLPTRSFIPVSHKPSAASLGDRRTPPRRASDAAPGHQSKRSKWDRNR